MLYRKIKTMHYWLPCCQPYFLCFRSFFPHFFLTPWTRYGKAYILMVFSSRALPGLYPSHSADRTTDQICDWTCRLRHLGSSAIYPYLFRRPVACVSGTRSRSAGALLQHRVLHPVQTHCGADAVHLPVCHYGRINRTIQPQAFYEVSGPLRLAGMKISTIFCDIDNFKKLNDTQGHARADEVLKQVAAIMEEELDGIGITGRYGGEELVALVVDRKVKPAQVAESIRARVASESIVTISIGYSVLRKGVRGDELMKQADKAMYHSKTTGKTRYPITGP